jgi:hypothetical protein
VLLLRKEELEENYKKNVGFFYKMEWTLEGKVHIESGKLLHDLYCLADVKPGKYECRFIQNNSLLAIQRLP